MNDKGFPAGDVIKLYGVYRCSCGGQEFFGICGRRFPRLHCEEGAWQMVHRAREETFF
jgi:hypothetical protein